MTLRHHCCLLVSLIVLGSVVSVAQDGRESAVVRPRVMSPAEFIAQDSLSGRPRTDVPGEVITQITNRQDSLFRAAMQVDVPAHVRFSASVRELQTAYQTQRAIQRDPTPWELALHTMNIPASMLQPSAVEVTQYKIGIANSQYVPGVLMYPMGSGNMQVRLSDIYAFFGLTEDVSPKLVYQVDETIYIEIVVYSTQARVVSTMFRGIQPAGRYEITWNGRDDNGRPVANGDYVAEVRYGNERITRKRIVWPSAK